MEAKGGACRATGLNREQLTFVSDSILINSLVVIILVCINGFFVASEYGIVRVRSSKIYAMAADGNKKAESTKRVIGDLDTYLLVCQIGITIASLGVGWVGELVVASIIPPLLAFMGWSDLFVGTIALVSGFLVMIIFHILIGERSPKKFAIKKPEKVALFTAPILISLNKLFRPFIWLMDSIAAKITQGPVLTTEAVPTEGEIRVLLNERYRYGQISKDELEIVENVFDFVEKTAHYIMVPRSKMLCLYRGKSDEENIAFALANGKTRYPVCDGDKDHIVGFVNVNDLLAPLSQRKSLNWDEAIQELQGIPESLPLRGVLRFMHKKKAEMIAVIDEYGGTSGLITSKDILGKLVGDFSDEKFLIK